jgi:polyribonucleotide nucleotidyltransferase
VSELSDRYVDRVTDFVNMGDEVKVKVILIDDQGRIKLSRKEAMKELGESDPEPVGAPSGGGGERHEGRGDRGPRRDDRGPRRDDRGPRRDDRGPRRD